MLSGPVMRQEIGPESSCLLVSQTVEDWFNCLSFPFSFFFFFFNSCSFVVYSFCAVSFVVIFLSVFYFSKMFLAFFSVMSFFATVKTHILFESFISFFTRCFLCLDFIQIHHHIILWGLICILGGALNRFSSWVVCIIPS